MSHERLAAAAPPARPSSRATSSSPLAAVVASLLLGACGATYGQDVPSSPGADAAASIHDDLGGAPAIDFASVAPVDESAPAADDLASAPPPDFAGSKPDLSMPKGSCTSACDCMTGLACSAGKCVVKISPIYCCTKGSCPAGKSCDYPDGKFGKCGAGVNCASVSCKTGGTSKCIAMGCTMCVTKSGTCK